MTRVSLSRSEANLVAACCLSLAVHSTHDADGNPPPEATQPDDAGNDTCCLAALLPCCLAALLPCEQGVALTQPDRISACGLEHEHTATPNDQQSNTIYQACQRDPPFPRRPALPSAQQSSKTVTPLSRISPPTGVYSTVGRGSYGALVAVCGLVYSHGSLRFHQAPTVAEQSQQAIVEGTGVVRRPDQCHGPEHLHTQPPEPTPI